ncbi:hypothetical protein IWW36_001826 [Coemansia brasiliensis]|uniref:HMG box domain-containing protein n=1 Tax=Coemansia brasiliensis TaxID=2650707 RepID=A0A9W8IAT4_9FUNG|nr:hypothetical protein IWW36_001826 [Coemansia brasiliensis]
MLRIISSFSALKVASYPAGVRAFSAGSVRLLQTEAQSGKKSASKKPAAIKRTKTAKAAAPKRPKMPTKKELLEALIKVPKRTTPRAFAVFMMDLAKDKTIYSGKITELAQICSVKWNDMSESERLKYHEEAKRIKAEHEKYLRQWWSTADQDLIALENQRRKRQKGSKARLIKDPFAPKRPGSAYTFFVRERMGGYKTPEAELGPELMKELMKSVSEEWKRMSAAERAPFAKTAELESARYKQNVEKYRKSHAA